MPETQRVATGHREWDVFQAPLDALSYSILDEPSGDQSFYQTANIVWPEDRSCCVKSETDLICTYVGGPESLIVKILGSPHLDAHVAHPRDAFWESDPVNGPGRESGDRIDSRQRPIRGQSGRAGRPESARPVAANAQA